MSLHDYFENTQGIGILATADSNGIVDTAVVYFKVDSVRPLIGNTEEYT